MSAYCSSYYKPFFYVFHLIISLFFLQINSKIQKFKVFLHLLLHITENRLANVLSQVKKLTIPQKNAYTSPFPVLLSQNILYSLKQTIGFAKSTSAKIKIFLTCAEPCSVMPFPLGNVIFYSFAWCVDIFDFIKQINLAFSQKTEKNRSERSVQNDFNITY